MMKKRKAKRINKVNEVNSDEQIEKSEFSDKEIELLNLIAKIIVRISIEESHKKD